jgi:DNA-directed RNA polymerase subunit M/transcription elongation factor TFIIS
MNTNIKFCGKCDNKYYHRIEENQLRYYCRVCGNIEANVTTEALCVLDTQFQQNTHNYDFIVNKYTKFDPTLPHIFVRCPNDACTTNSETNVETNVENGENSETGENSGGKGKDSKEKVTDAIYLRYDNTQLKYIYICTTCDHKWKTE